ncbi:MAG TPA: leucyl/phenylalanyl-tRNA--protein transferase [Methylophilaceae bacterium]|nr:leucyl/phenylalanyl-tRNA--protein transferase [Methylophilaceae bacterium]
MIPWLPADIAFPPPSQALREPNGLLAAGGDLSPERLLAAYRLGIFPWYSEGQPILWWSPDPRMVLLPAELRISRSLARRLRKTDYEVRFDSAFTKVMQACADTYRLGQDGTWITADIIRAYTQLHELGFAHSVETWINGELAGGIYGVAIGRMFYGESMFHHVTDASKIAFVHLMKYLQRNNFGMMDCQMKTLHLASLGAREIPREEFAHALAKLVNYSDAPGKWSGHDTPQ